MEDMNHTCAGGTCGCGCHSKWGGKGSHYLIKTILKLFIIMIVFAMGYKLGFLTGALRGGYGGHMFYGNFNKQMMDDVNWDANTMMKKVLAPEATTKQ